jgi:predicted PurR-regulated permease PerM
LHLFNAPGDRLLDNQLADRFAFKIVFYSVVAGAAIWLALQLKVIILVLILALTIASAMAPVADFAEAKKVPRVVTVILIYLFIAAVYVLMGMTLVPAIGEQLQTLNKNLPDYIDKLQRWYDSAMNYAGTISIARPTTEDLKSFGGHIVHKTLDLSAGLAGLALNGVLLLFLSAYFVVEAKPIWNSILRWLPRDVAEKWAPHIVPLAQRMGGYVRGQLLTALAVAVFFAITFSAIRLPYGLALATLSGLLNLVPYVGSFTATVLAFIVGINQSPLMAVLVVVIFAVEQWLESTIFVPFLLGRQVSLHPLVVLLSMIAGASLLGIIGAIIAIPLAAGGMYLAEEFYLKPREQAEVQQPG